MSSLLNVIDLVKEGDQKIIEQNEEQTKRLESIDRNIMEFLGMQKRKRLDDLEDRRETKSKTRLGLGKKAAGAGLAAGALGGGLLGDALGEGVDTVKLVAAGALLAAGASKLVKATKASVKMTTSGIEKASSALDATTKKINAAEADAKKRIADADKKLKKVNAEIKTAEKSARTDPDANDPRKQSNIDKLKAEAANIERQRAEAARDLKAAEDAKKEKNRDARRAKLAELESQKAERARLATLDADDPRNQRNFEIKDGKAYSTKTGKRLTGGAEALAKRTAELDAGDTRDLNKATPAPVDRVQPKVPVDGGLDTRNLDKNRTGGPKGGGLGNGALRAIDAVDNPLLAALDEASTAIANRAGGGVGTKVASMVSKGMGFISSTAGLAGQLMITPSALADGTMTGKIVGTYNDMIVAMMQGGEDAIDIIEDRHKTLKELAPNVPELDLGPILNMNSEELLDATKALYDRTRNRLHVPTAQQTTGSSRAMGQTGRGGFAGDETNALDAMSDTAAKLQGQDIGPTDYTSRREEAKGLSEAYQELLKKEKVKTANISTLPVQGKIQEVNETAEKLDTTSATQQTQSVNVPVVNQQTDQSVRVNNTQVQSGDGSITVDPKSANVPGSNWGR